MLLSPSLAYLLLFLLPFLHCQQYFILPLVRSSAVGQYYANITVGTPPQRQSVIIDNLNNMLLLNCQGCLSCKYSQRNQPFQPEASFTNKQIECKDQLAICNNYCKGKLSTEKCEPKQIDSYGDYTAKIQSDIISIGQNQGSTVRHYLGCINTEVADTYHEENGILGLHRSPLNVFYALLGLKDTESIQQLGFCFAQNRGYAEIGTLPQRDYKNYARLVMHQQNIFGVGDILDITFGNLSIFSEHYLKGTGLLFLTRSSQTIMPTSTRDIIIKNIKATCNETSCNVIEIHQQAYRKNMTCLSFAKEIEPDELFPPFSFVTQSNYSFIWKASEYMFKGQGPEGDSSSSIYYCLAFTNSSRIQKFALGLNYWQNKHIIFDIKGAQILLNEDNDCSDYNIPQNYALLKYIPYLVILFILCFRHSLVSLVRRLSGYTQPDIKESKLEMSNDQNMLEMK